MIVDDGGLRKASEFRGGDGSLRLLNGVSVHKGCKGEICSGCLSSCVCKLKLEFLTLLWTASRYEGYKCAVGKIGVERWVDTLVLLCDLVC